MGFTATENPYKQPFFLNEKQNTHSVLRSNPIDDSGITMDEALTIKKNSGLHFPYFPGSRIED